MTILVYDGSFAGWLSAVFSVYERKLDQVKIVTEAARQPDAFATFIVTNTDEQKAARVWKGLQQRLSADACDRIYYTFLSENEGTEELLLAFCRYAFSKVSNIETDFSSNAVLEVTQTARKVWREKHRMEAFVRFRELKDGLFYAAVEPDHNVLPLILPHFRSRYADQHWLIYDIRRGYGVHYNKDNGQVSEVQIDFTLDRRQASGPGHGDITSPDEELYQLLWKDYFKHTGIPERRNMQLHLRHIPRRYWKYLTEKNS